MRRGRQLFDRRSWLALPVGLAMVVSAAGDDPPVASHEKVFVSADANGDKRLTIDEFRALPGKLEVHDRDFRLFDFDNDQRLSLSEFAVVPGVTPGPRGGEVPDPLQDLLESGIAAVDAAFGNRDQNPGGMVATELFAQSFHGSVYPEGVGQFGENLTVWADPNHDGWVSRQEEKRFLSMQLGMATQASFPLRDPSGRVVMWGRFLALDADKSGNLERGEVFALRKDGKVVVDFLEHDLDRNGKLSLGEFARWFGADDPIERFCRGDADLDGRLDQHELEAVTPEELQALIPCNLKAFDDDTDRRLSLPEYQLSMLGNAVWNWEETLDDHEEDGFLDFSEWNFGKRRFRLLLRCYFDRLDVNHDLHLAPEEFPFKPGTPREQRPAAAAAPMLRLVPAQRAPN